MTQLRGQTEWEFYFENTVSMGDACDLAEDVFCIEHKLRFVIQDLQCSLVREGHAASWTVHSIWTRGLITVSSN